MTRSASREKRLSLDALVDQVKKARRRGETIVMTNGCFDLLHSGHLYSLEQARQLGDRLVVAINSDASIRKLKGPDRPIQPARVRRQLVAGLACVDWVVEFGGLTPLRAIRAVQPDILAKGGDWADDEIVGREDVEGWGGRVVRLKLRPGESTTALIERIRKGSPRLPRSER